MLAGRVIFDKRMVVPVAYTFAMTSGASKSISCSMIPIQISRVIMSSACKTDPDSEAVMSRAQPACPLQEKGCDRPQAQGTR